LFPPELDYLLDSFSAMFMIIGLIYIIKLHKYGANPVLMIFSPLVIYKYLIFLIALIVAFFVVDFVANHVLQSEELLSVGFEFALASGSFGVMLLIRRVYEQVAHPENEKVKRRLKDEVDDIARKRLRYFDSQFRKANK